MKLLERLSPQRAVHVFVAMNIAFLGLDIVVAHMMNGFAERIEWAPVVFSAVATPLLVPGAVGSERPVFATVDKLVAWGAILVGVLGMIFHLESGFFEEQTLRNLVYSAPFVAPLSYVGVGLLLLLVRSEEAATPAFGPWVLLLALGGFIGNFGLSVLDHAQNGFFRPSEWVPVAAAALGIGFLSMAIVSPSPTLTRTSMVMMAIEVVVGVSGFVLHVQANFGHGTASFVDRFVFGAPAFAPLLFANVALLACIGLWATQASPRAQPSTVATAS